MEIYIGIFMYVINYFDVTVTAPKCPRAELSRRRVGIAELAAPSWPISPTLVRSPTAVLLLYKIIQRADSYWTPPSHYEHSGHFPWKVMLPECC